MHTDRPRIPGVGRKVPKQNEAAVEPIWAIELIPDCTLARVAVFSHENEDSPEAYPSHILLSFSRKISLVPLFVKPASSQGLGNEYLCFERNNAKEFDVRES